MKFLISIILKQVNKRDIVRSREGLVSGYCSMKLLIEVLRSKTLKKNRDIWQKLSRQDKPFIDCGCIQDGFQHAPRASIGGNNIYMLTLLPLSIHIAYIGQYISRSDFYYYGCGIMNIVFLHS